ncbi:DUF5677 domain-containing protein [Bradyrhizobium sp. Pha-3]|uniref:DUF5677 domain-containing protein n=1 Tax=Bradyrhizobium sp. Pha-3 TaxID=208375 RepID=UPI0035D40595
MSPLIADWRSLCSEIETCAMGIFATADVKITPKGFADPQFLALALLARCVSNLKGALILLDASLIVEARTITRCCLENLYWTVGLAEHGDEFVKQMQDDELTHRRLTGQSFFEMDVALDGEVEDRLRAFMRKLNKDGSTTKTLNPRGVAGIREDFRKTYIFYAQLSSDAAHPSVSALSRYVVADHPEGPGFDTEPVVRPGETIETYEYLAMACLGVCVGANQLLGGTAGGARLNALAGRQSALSNASKGTNKLD